MQRHRLKREIIATAVTNSMINRMGATFMMRMQEDTGQTPAAVAKAYTAAREILDARELWAQIEALDGKVAESTQIDAMLQIWSLLRHMTRWLLNRPGTARWTSQAKVERYRPGMAALRAALPAALTATGRASFEVDMEKWEGLGLPARTGAADLAEMPELRGGAGHRRNVAANPATRSKAWPACSSNWARRWTSNGCARRSSRCRWKATGMRRRAVRLLR